MKEGLEEALFLVQHERNKLNMMMVGEDWDESTEGFASGLDRAEELIQNMLNNCFPKENNVS